MKKILTFLISVFFIIAFTACNGTKKTEAPAAAPIKSDSIAQVASTDSVVPTKSPADMLKDFQDYVKSYGDAFNNSAKDPQKYITLAGQSQKRVAAMDQVKDQLTPAQLQDYQKARDLIIKINKGGK